MGAKGDSRLLRLLNAQRIMDAMFDASPAGISRAQVARLTGLSKPTVSTLVGELESEGVLQPVRASKSGRVGRPATPYELVPSAGHALGVDIGGSKIIAGIADLLGHVQIERQVETAADAQAVIAQVVMLADRLQDELDCTMDTACVGVPGVYHSETDRVDQAPNLPGFEGMKVAAQLGKELGVGVWVENDVNLAALGEASATPADDEPQNFVALSVGRGVGAGLILDGELYRGGLDGAGEIGSLVVSTDGSGGLPVATLEDVASAPGISKGYQSSVESGMATGLAGSPSVREILAAASEGDAAAGNSLSKAAESMALAVSHLNFILNPEKVIFGGGVGANPVFVDAVAAALSRIVSDPVEVVASKLGPRAAFLGATTHAVETLQRALVGERLGDQQRQVHQR